MTWRAVRVVYNLFLFVGWVTFVPAGLWSVVFYGDTPDVHGRFVIGACVTIAILTCLDGLFEAIKDGLEGRA